MAAALSGVALLIVLATWGRYLWTIPRDRVPARPVASVILQGIGMVLGAAAIVLGFRGPEPLSAAVVTNAATATAMGTATATRTDTSPQSKRR